jgi:DNA-binding MarR family transcriptional regulator
MADPIPINHARYEAFLQLLRTADTVWNASREFLAPWDLGPSQFNVLNLLRGRPEGCSQTELSRELIMHRSNVTGLVDRLEKRGLVVRKTVEGDRRAYRVVLTAVGKQVMASILPVYFAGADELWGDLPDQRVKLLTSDLREAARNAERIARERESKPKRSHENKTPQDRQ